MPGDKPAGPRDLTGEEAALYDRQIRLWGVDAQRRLSASHVLLTGAVCGPLGHEVAKNIVLAGVARLGLCSAGSPDSPSFLGNNVEATAQALREMNPLVDVMVIDDAQVHLASFTVLCSLALPHNVDLHLAERCRDSGVAFMTGRCAGRVGWFFSDLGKSYTYQTKKRRETGGEATDFVYETLDEQTSFCTYSDAVTAAWGRETRRSEFGWHVALTLLQFEAEHARLPAGDESDTQTLLKLYARLCAERKCAHEKKELMEQVGRTACYSLPPVAAIVGGMWGRELIKFVSRKDPPVNNFFFFNAATSAGSVERVGP